MKKYTKPCFCFVFLEGKCNLFVCLFVFFEIGNVYEINAMVYFKPGE